MTKKEMINAIMAMQSLFDVEEVDDFSFRIKTKREHCTFSQDDLDCEWAELCDMMPRKWKGIDVIMKEMSPKLNYFDDKPSVVVMVEDSLKYNLICEIKGYIEGGLMMLLHNTDLRCSIIQK